MNWPFELQVGWRYTRAGRGGRRNAFISPISGVSILGIALGVTLIIVLSVMNGFQREVRDRMLERDCPRRAAGLPGRSGGRLAICAGLVCAGKNPAVVGAAPFVATKPSSHAATT